MPTIRTIAVSVGLPIVVGVLGFLIGVNKNTGGQHVLNANSSPITVSDGSIKLCSGNAFTPNDGNPHQDYTVDDSGSQVPYIETLGCPSSPTPGIPTPTGCPMGFPPSVLKHGWTLTLDDGSSLKIDSGSKTKVKIHLSTPVTETTSSDGSHCLELARSNLTHADLVRDDSMNYRYTCPNNNPTGKCLVLVHYCPGGICN